MEISQQENIFIFQLFPFKVIDVEQDVKYLIFYLNPNQYKQM
jgi:hypothetical protein